jgi:hypothetical protein
VSGRDVIWIMEIDRWASGRGEMNQIRSQRERQSGVWP